MVEVRHVEKAYGERVVLRDFSAVFPEGSLTLVTGPSGAGKTTLLRLLLGLERPDAGEVAGTRGLRLAAVFQEDRLCERLSARKNLLLTCPSVSGAVLEEHLERVGLSGEADTRVEQMSGGMKRRVAIVRAVLAGAQLLVLDEPMLGLDAGTKERVLDYLWAHLPGRTAVYVTHDPAEIRAAGEVRRLKIGEKIQQ